MKRKNTSYLRQALKAINLSRVVDDLQSRQHLCNREKRYNKLNSGFKYLSGFPVSTLFCHILTDLTYFYTHCMGHIMINSSEDTSFCQSFFH